jgi:release factor glutamine methyltransferase
MEEAQSRQWRVVDVIEWGKEYLARFGIENPRLNIELLLGDVICKKRLDLYLNFDRTLSRDELSRLKERVMRRSQHEPVQYIVGNAHFYGFEFELNQGCLIPRPETEFFVEVLLKEAAGSSPAPARILDVGAGSGVIAVTLAKQLPEARVTAVDVSSEALAAARRNAEKNGVGERVMFLEGDLFSPLPAGAAFDLIVSNPPYIRSGEFAGLPREVREYEPALALNAGDPEGLSFYRRIIDGARDRLVSGGILAFEVGDDRQAVDVEKLFEKTAVFSKITRFPDYNQISRAVIGRLRA